MPYKHAPITEAIFDIKVEGSGVDNIERLEEIHRKTQSEFPNVRKKSNYSGVITFKPDTQNVHTENKMLPLGFVYSNGDGSRQFQARLDGFTYNMLSPYTQWEDFSLNALQLWNIYEAVLRPTAITRIALRYINRIMLPIPFRDFDDYFTSMPSIPKNLPQTFSGFFTQIKIPIIKENRFVILTHTIEEATSSKLPFIIDIDAFELNNIHPRELQDKFNELRVLKNEIFENCITDETRKLFE